MVQLHKKTVDVYDRLEAALEKLPMHIVSSPQSPMIHLRLREKVREQLNLPLMYGNSTFITTGKPAKLLNEFDEYLNLESFILQKVIDYVLEHEGILITRSKLILEHENLPVLPPHLLIMINIGVKEEELDRVVEVLPKAIENVFSNIKSEEDLLQLRDELVNY